MLIHTSRSLAAMALLMLVPLVASAQLNLVSRNSQLKFDGTNFGTTDQVQSSASLSDPFDAVFADSLLHDTPNGINVASYAMSQHDVVSGTLLETVHEANCEITQAPASPVMRLTGDFDVEFTVDSDTVITLDGSLSGSSNVALDPYTATVLDVASLVGTPDVFNSLFSDFPLITTLTPGNTYRLRVDARATCDSNPLTNSDSVEVRLEVAPDSDDDGVLNFEDNCVLVPNSDQRDSNADGIGNACDADLNGDCSVNFGDLAELKSAFFPNPYDDDADFNGDGFVNFGDLAFMKSTFFIGGTPGPGPSSLPNDCD